MSRNFLTTKEGGLQRMILLVSLVVFAGLAVTAEEADRLEVGGTIVGMFESVPYDHGETTLEHGDILVVSTDGISESWGEDVEEYGKDRLAEVFKNHAKLSAPEMIVTIQQEVDAYATSRPTDDLTLIVVRRV